MRPTRPNLIQPETWDWFMIETQIVRRTSELLEGEVDGELVALNIASGTCYGFNSTATRVWAMLEEPKRVADIRDALVSEFEVDASTCQQQLVALLQELQKDGLVAVDGPTEGV